MTIMKQIVKGFTFHVILETKEMENYSKYLRSNLQYEIQAEVLNNLRLPLLHEFERIIYSIKQGQM